jgi:hypothetical protein
MEKPLLSFVSAFDCAGRRFSGEEFFSADFFPACIIHFDANLSEFFLDFLSVHS